MLELSRTVRLCVNDGADADEALASPRHNGYAGWPAMRGLGRFYELHIACAGEADPVTGYFINIKEIDAAVRTHALPLLTDAVRSGRAGDTPMGGLLRRMLDSISPALRGSVERITLSLSPFYNLSIRSRDMGHVIVRESFEFAAAHRLHVPQLGEDENRRVFGKCNNPSGHGHNYRLEVALRLPVDGAGRVVPVGAVDALVDEAVIQRLDHTHLNVDVPQFASLNPSVENIAKVVFDMLAPRVGELGAGVVLEEVRVWETEKTVCTYRGDGR